MGKFISKNLLLLLRLAAASIYGYSIYYQQVNNTTPVLRPFGKLKYLTYWDLLLQFGFFTLASVANLLKIKSLQKTVDFLFYSLAFPVGMIVSITFWALYAIDRELIFPVILEKYYPNWLNHSTHTLVSLFVIIELFLAKHKLPSFKSGLIMLNAFTLTYVVWVLYIALTHDFWVYPFLEVLNWPQRIAFFVITSLANSSFYLVGMLGNKLTTSKSKAKVK